MLKGLCARTWPSVDLAFGGSSWHQLFWLWNKRFGGLLQSACQFQSWASVACLRDGSIVCAQVFTELRSGGVSEFHAHHFLVVPPRTIYSHNLFESLCFLICDTGLIPPATRFSITGRKAWIRYPMLLLLTLLITTIVIEEYDIYESCFELNQSQ